MSKIQRVAGTALTSVALVSLAACGGSSSKSASSAGKSAASSGKAAATSGAAAGSSATSTSSGNSNGTGAEQTISGTELSQKQKSAAGSDYAVDFSLTSKSANGSMNGSGVTSVKGGKTDMKMTINAAGKTINEIAAGGVMYMQINGQWYKMDGTTGTQGAVSKMLSQSNAGQLTDQAKNQQWKIVSSDSSGTTYETTLKAGTVNSAASSMSLNASAPADEKITEVTDAKGRLIKVTGEIPGSATVEYTMSNYRAPITITAPANAKSFTSANLGN